MMGAQVDRRSPGSQILPIPPASEFALAWNSPKSAHNRPKQSLALHVLFLPVLPKGNLRFHGTKTLRKAHFGASIFQDQPYLCSNLQAKNRYFTLDFLHIFA